MKKHFIITNIIFVILLATAITSGKREADPAWTMLVVLFAIHISYFLLHFVKKSAAASDICSIVYVFLLIWDILAKHLDLTNVVLLPPPEDVFYVFYTHGKMMIEGVVASMELIIAGFAVSLSAGIGLGLLIGWIPRLTSALYPIVKVLAPIPSIVYTPYIIALMPTFRSASVMVIILGLFFPTLMQMINRVHTIDRHIVDSARTMNVNNRDMICKVFLPYMIPGVVGGLRISLSSAFMILVIAEMMGATCGLGYFIKNYADFANYTNVIAGIIMVGVVVTLLNGCITIIQKYFIRWKMS